MKTLIKYIIAVFIGITTGLVTIFVVPSRYEVIVWVIVILLLAYTSGQLSKVRSFKLSFLFAVTSGASITATHLFFLKEYLESHSDEIQMLEQTNIFDSYYATLILVAPIYWLVLGILSGLLALLLDRLKE